MKEITIIRHAKSDWGEEFQKDIDRHLSARGITDAYFMSDWFVKNANKPDLILTSPATRAFSTAMIFARKLELKQEQIIIDERIYEADVKSLFSVVQSTENTKQSVVLFGHNPGLTNFCNVLSDDLFFDNLPTCAIASYQCAIKDWKELGTKKCKLIYYEFPKNFKS